MTTLSMFIRCNICASLGDISLFILHSVPKVQDTTLNWKQSCNTWLCDLAESAHMSTHLTEAYGHYCQNKSFIRKDILEYYGAKESKSV